MSYLFTKGTFSIFCNILKRIILLPTSLKLHNSDQKMIDMLLFIINQLNSQIYSVEKTPKSN